MAWRWRVRSAPTSSSAAPPGSPAGSRARRSAPGRCLLALRIPRKLRESGDAGVLLDFEIGALLAVAAEAALLRFDGDLGGRFSPAVYVLVALVAAFSRPLAGVLVVVWVVALEAAIRIGDAASGRPRGLRHPRVLRGRLRAPQPGAAAGRGRPDPRDREGQGRGAARANQRGRAELPPPRRRRGRRSRRSAERPPRARERRGDPPVGALRARPAAPLARPAHGGPALAERRGDAPSHQRAFARRATTSRTRPLASGDGVLGAVLAQRKAVSLAGLKPTFKVPYYPGPCPVRALAAIPVLEGETLRGVLAIDRLRERRVLRTRRGDGRPGGALLPAGHPERAGLPAARARQGRAGQALPRGAGARRGAQREGRRRRRA